MTIEEKRFSFIAYSLLHYGTVRKANAHCTHLQNAHVDPQSKICKSLQFYQFASDTFSYNIYYFYYLLKSMLACH